MLYLMQLTAYVVATGCLSFSDDKLGIKEHSFYSECARFWTLTLGGIPRVPGGSVETVALFLGHLCCQTIEDSESDAGKILPATVIVATVLIRCTDFSSTDFNDIETRERVASLLFSLYKCVLRAGSRRFQELPSLFAFECLATLAKVGCVTINLSKLVSCLLIEALIHRISFLQTALLLEVQGFPELLLLGEPAWTTLAQKITYHCHSQEQLTRLDFIEKLPLNYEFLSIIWSVWFPLLRDLERQNVVRRLSETFENGCASLEHSRACWNGEVSSKEFEKSPQPIGAERLALFVAEQFVKLPIKLEIQVCTLFFESDAFRINFLRMLTLVVRLEGLFFNRACLNRFVEIVATLLTDSRCEDSGNLIDLLKLLNTCLLMTGEIGLSQGESSLLLSFTEFEFILVTPHIIERIGATKASWMYAERSTMKTMNYLLMEEVCVLGTMLMFGEGPSGLYTKITPFKSKGAEDVYCPIFAIPDVLLRAIKGEAPARVSLRACCSATLLLLYAPKGLLMGPWPSYQESPNCKFYFQLLIALYSNLMDATLNPLRLIISALFGRTLSQGSEEMVKANAPKEGPLFGDSIWNSIIIERFQLENFDNENFPFSPSLLAFLAEVVMVSFMAHFKLSKNKAVTFLTNAARNCIRHKLQTEKYSMKSTSLPSLATYRQILLPELLTNFHK
ncbi:unnamed protein product [Hydatigera taeniaeformis]|uniref:Uncharacterized protein n=1 Tax=Hydatigena taeniaeformis TaxID=6205 RepID=A0A0R3WZF4_HYDTA|nr:unnamed protein product [Hydatigera taeniaeformis]